MTSNQLEISPRKQQLKEEYLRLQKEYTELVAKRDEMLLCEGPRLEAKYMEAIGQLQYEVLQLEYEVALLKLERDLMQSYLNRGEGIEVATVQMKVEETAKTYQEDLQEEEEKIEAAKAYNEEHQEDDSKERKEELRSLKQLYKSLVHRLHPDLHPDQSEWEKELFLKVQEAYANQDYDKLRQLEEQLNAGQTTSGAPDESIDEWEKRVARLKEQIAKLCQEIEHLESQFPFTYRKKLRSPKWMASQRAELELKIEQLQKERDRLRKVVDMMKGVCQ